MTAAATKPRPPVAAEPDHEFAIGDLVYMDDGAVTFAQVAHTQAGTCPGCGGTMLMVRGVGGGGVVQGPACERALIVVRGMADFTARGYDRLAPGGEA